MTSKIMSLSPTYFSQYFSIPSSFFMCFCVSVSGLFSFLLLCFHTFFIREAFEKKCSLFEPPESHPLSNFCSWRSCFLVSFYLPMLPGVSLQFYTYPYPLILFQTVFHLVPCSSLVCHQAVSHLVLCSLLVTHQAVPLLVSLAVLQELSHLVSLAVSSLAHCSLPVCHQALSHLVSPAVFQAVFQLGFILCNAPLLCVTRLCFIWFFDS